MRSASSARLRGHERLGVGGEDDRQPVRGERRLRQHLPGAGVLDVEPAVGDLVVRQQVADALRVGRQPIADHAHGVAVSVREAGRARCGGTPVLEQVVEHGVQPLLGGMPGLHEVVVEPDLVDGAHRHLGVGVRGEEDALRVRGFGGDMGEQLDARHPRHALIGDDERQRVTTRHEAADEIQGLLAGLCGEHREVPRIVVAEIALDGADDLTVVVDCEQHRLPFGHRLATLKTRSLLGSRRSWRDAERSARGCRREVRETQRARRSEASRSSSWRPASRSRKALSGIPPSRSCTSRTCPATSGAR